jgi:hypothetical protein
MKKLNMMLHDPKVQGNLLLSFIFVLLTVIMILTWSK